MGRLKDKIIKFVEEIIEKDLDHDGSIGEPQVKPMPYKSASYVKVDISKFNAGTVKWAILTVITNFVSEGKIRFYANDLIDAVRSIMADYGRFPLDSTILRSLRELREKGYIAYKYDRDKDEYILVAGEVIKESD